MSEEEKKDNPVNPHNPNPLSLTMVRDIASLKTDVDWIKKGLESIDKKLWGVISAIVVAVVINTVLHYFG